MDSAAPPPKSWEVSETDWPAIMSKVRAVLESTARDRSTLSYSDLVQRVPGFSGPDSHALAKMLGDTNASERVYKGAPLLLSAVVVHKHDMYPGGGFFAAARHLGVAVPESDERRRIMWAEELARVHEAYGSKGDR